uniref:BHLH4 n=1 Tax=Fagopyrum tataricum TaxID=62330 RepID=A0A0U4K4W4_FAGTA|nr:bHLH4 [Fagopyrum tataricum]
MNMADELFQTGIFDGMTWWNTNPTKNFFSGGGLSSPYCSTAAGGDGLGMAWSTLSKSNSVSLFDDPSMVDSSNTLQAMGFDDVSWNHQPIINGDYVNTMIQAEEWSSSPPAAMNSTGNSSGTDGSTLSCDALAVVNSFPVDPSSLFTNTILNQEHEILPPCDWTHNVNDQVLGSSFDNHHQQQQQIINHIRATLLGGSPAPSLPPSPKPQTRKTTNAKANKREEGSDSEPSIKRQRIETPSPLPTFKVRKEKLGDRITALQQLVSPFGKTDTASVLHEAIEYIKFLHDQVNGLSTPYTKNGAPIQHHHQHKQAKGEATNQDLRSRGLCLVPISSTFPVAHETPADFWTPTLR